MIAYFLLCIDVVYYVWGMFQIERIPDVALFVQGSTHLLEVVPFYVAHLTALHRAPPFTITVDGSFSSDGNILSLAGIDGWGSTVFFLTVFFIYLDEVVLILREDDDGILFQMQVDIVLQGYQAGEIDTCRYIEVTAAHLVQFTDSLAECLGIHRLTIAVAAKVQNANLVVGDGRQGRLLHLHWQVLVVLAVVFGT